jgi:hypothetical protein
MTAVSGKVTSGLYLQYTTSSLSQGGHYFRFQFDDGSGLQTFQEYNMNVTPIVLRGSKVSPTTANSTTPLTFSTVYYGPDTPTAVDVVIDGTSYPLSYVSGDPGTGATYATTTTLAAGSHAFAFYATDGANSWSDPPTPGTYTGLTIAQATQARVHSTIVAPPGPSPYGPEAP